MPADEDLLFGKIALTKGFCTEEQVDECIKMQAMTDEAPPLGELLLYKTFLTPEQHALILKEQNESLQKVDPLLKKRKESILFGKLAVQEGLLTEEQVNECLRDQAKDDETRSLGEVMVAGGYLTEKQVKELLARQQKRIMSCPVCRLSFTVLSLSHGKTVHCPRCKGALQEGKTGASTRTDAEFATTVLRAVKASVPAESRGASRVIPPAAKMVQATCVVCDHAFGGPVDSTGRMRCPSCNSTFVPK